jgi:hypothetical protein
VRRGLLFGHQTRRGICGTSRIKRGWPTCCAPTEPSRKFTTNCLAMTGGENGIPSRPKQRSLATVVEVVPKRCRNHVGVQWSDEIEGIETGLLRNSPISNFSSRRRRKDLTCTTRTVHWNETRDPETARPCSNTLSS